MNSNNFRHYPDFKDAEIKSFSSQSLLGFMGVGAGGAENGRGQYLPNYWMNGNYILQVDGMLNPNI